MAIRRSRPSHLSLAQRVSAGGLAALIFMLGLLAVSPTWHAWLHTEPDATRASGDHSTPHHTTAATDHLCVISGFAHGVTSGLDYVAIEQPTVQVASHLPTAIPLQLPPTRWVLQPGRAPPAV